MTTIFETHKRLKDGQKVADVTSSFLNKAKELNPSINAYITLCEKASMAQAEAAQKRLDSGKNITPLTGVPIGLKDALVTKGIPTTAGSRILQNHTPVYNGTVVQKLIDAGAVIVGKTNMDEFAMGSSNENSFYNAVKNPWNTDYVPGGSSGGSAAAVSADMCVAALGSDTGGSIRQPASYTGIVGVKPTYGRVSRYGLIAFASSLDQIGPMTKDVRDSAIMLNTICGYDDRDSTSLNLPVPDFTKSLTGDVKGLKIGIPKEYFGDGIDSHVLNAVNDAKKTLESQGATCIDISLPHTEYAIAAYYIIAPAEASANLARFDGVRFGYRSKNAKNLKEMYDHSRTEGFGSEVKRRIIIGTYVLSSGYYDAYYKRAQCVRSLIKKDFEDAFQKVDVILTPTAPSPAFKLNENTSDPLKMYLADIFTVPTNLAGLPGISLPCGFTNENLPIGLQILAKPLDEETMLKAAYAFEQNTQWHKKRPEL